MSRQNMGQVGSTQWSKLGGSLVHNHTSTTPKLIMAIKVGMGRHITFHLGFPTMWNPRWKVMREIKLRAYASLIDFWPMAHNSCNPNNTKCGNKSCNRNPIFCNFHLEIMMGIEICCNPSLGLLTKARARKNASQERSPGMWESVRMNTHTPKWTPILGVGVPVDSRIFKSDCKGQKPLSWGVHYIIGKIFKRRCRKWACITHLDIQNTSYGQKKGQFDSRP
jgi:hypothetical protein